MSRDSDPGAGKAADDDVTMTDAEMDPSSSNQAKRKKKATKQSSLTQCTIRNPAWAYIHMTLVGTSDAATGSVLDALTAQIQLQAALSSFLGLHGTAIPFDFLKIERRQLWLRVPREDVSAVVAAVGGWVGKSGEGWRVNNWSCWGPDVGKNAGLDLYDR
ncbi:hypothetical protein AAFC00_005266 [Neodothiora populina]|uniref:Ribonucleases P/MRP subunit Pop8-like domain-containing protein n=1 Tax=Neodothiora populina TaxID=2781224 RepID=A0ABR3PKC5_9PEZI